MNAQNKILISTKIDTKYNVWNVFIVTQKNSEMDHSAQQVGIADQLDYPPFSQLYRLFSLAFNILKFCNFWRSNTLYKNDLATRRLILSLFNLIFSSSLSILGL